MDIAKINPNTQKGKYIVIVSRIAEDVTTAWHATIGHVEKKRAVASARSRVLSCRAGPERGTPALPMASMSFDSFSLECFLKMVSHPSSSTRLKTLAHLCHPAVYLHEDASVERSECR
jgi:hypothetical protein